MKYMFKYLLAKKQRIPGMKIFTTMYRRTAKAVHSNNYGVQNVTLVFYLLDSLILIMLKKMSTLIAQYQ